MGLVPEFEQFFSGYGAYHHNPVNKIIHIFCIPSILISGLQLLQHCTFRIDTPLIQITFPLLFILVLSFVYLQVDIVSGLVSSFFYISICLLGSQYYQSLKTDESLNQHFNYMLGLHIMSWIAQFIGHGVFEKRAPALADNLFYVFVAPNFVIIELMFLLGYNPEMQKKCDKSISESIRVYRKSLQKKVI